MVYKDLEVKVGQRKLNTATRVSVDYPTQISAKRKLGQNINAADQFNFDGPSEVGISLDFLLWSTENTIQMYDFEFLFDKSEFGALGNNTGHRSFELSIGANVFSDCYLDNYSITVRPFEPVMGTVKFTSYNPATGTIAAGTIDNVVDGNGLINGHGCSITNGDQAVSANVISEYKYTKTFRRTPVYQLGDENASSFLIDSAVADVSISSTGLAELIDYSGKEVVNDMVLSFVGANGGAGDGEVYHAGGSLQFTVPSGSRVISESYNVQGGDTVVANATIQNVIL